MKKRVEVVAIVEVKTSVVVEVPPEAGEDIDIDTAVKNWIEFENPELDWVDEHGNAFAAPVGPIQRAVFGDDEPLVDNEPELSMTDGIHITAKH